MHDTEDEREIELSSISAIYPEATLDTEKPFSISLDLPVIPLEPVPVVFPEASDGEASITLGVETHLPKLETHLLTYLPSLQVQISLPEGYPSTKPPIVQITTSPQWLPDLDLKRLQDKSVELWEEFGHDQVVFAYIDHLRQLAENSFGLLEGTGSLPISQDHKIAVLDFDIQATRAAFEKETFECKICQEPKKGSVCHRMLDCGHVFCRQCLQDFYNNAITEGDIVSVRCLQPNCAKKRSEVMGDSSGKRRKPRTRLSPNELLQIPLDHEMVKRYVNLKHKAELDSDKNTIYCPRKWCQGAARSKKHRKPAQRLESIESSDEESENENTPQDSRTGFQAQNELLAICEDCSFAFCRRCYQGWHGEFARCTPPRNVAELTEEDKASLEYLKLHTTPCPTCAAPAQKTHGCNHMICFRCNTHFCYLCSAWLEPGNPYQHFNVITTGCYMRLWELEGGDGDDVGYGFAGGVQGRPVEVEIPLEAIVDPEPEPENPLPNNARAAAVPQPNAVVPLLEPFAREGPLVLRIGQLPPRPAQAPAPQVPRPPQQNRYQGRGNFHRGAPGPRHAAAAQRRANQQAGNGPAPRAPRNIPGVVREDAAPVGAVAGAGVGDEAAARQAWVQNFVEMALNDEEDLVEWDSDDDEDIPAWAIPMR